MRSLPVLVLMALALSGLGWAAPAPLTKPTLPDSASPKGKPQSKTPSKVKSPKAPLPPPATVPLSAPAKIPPSVPARIDTAPKPLRVIGQKALRAPEKLLFNVIWGGWNFSWVKAGQATLELLPTKDSTQWEIRSLAWCNSFFQTFYPVQDTVTSLIDARGIFPLKFDKHLHEGSYNAHISAVYDQSRHTLKTQDTSLSIE